MASTPNFTDGTWEVVSTRNLGGDPNGDILWQNIANQNLTLWQQDGAATTAVADLPSITGFEVQVAGDFDGDGVADPFLRNPDSGANKVLLSSTGTLEDTSPNPTVPAPWYVGATSDTT